jgi:hypothetical protein
MPNFIALIYYPGVVGVVNPDFAHPVLVDMAETTPPLEPYAQPADTDGQGTIYHFPVTATATGNDPKLHSETHWHRAWSINGWETIRIQGSVAVATDVGRDSNASPYTPSASFDFTLTGAIDEKRMVDSIAIAAGSTAANTIFHLGTGNTGELVTNYGAAAAVGSIGPWTFYGLSETPTVLGLTATFKTMTAYDTNFVGGDVTRDLKMEISASVRGNSSVLRYVDGNGDWQFVSIFELALYAEIDYGDALPSGYAWEGPDGSRNPDETPSPGGSGYCSTNLSSIPGADSGNTSVGDCNFTSTESLTPDPLIYEDESTDLWAVPWLEADHIPADPYQPAVWTSVLVEFTDPSYNTVPSALA